MRTVIVGDVHGCAAELDSLLDTVAFASGDRLVFVGDLVARGPDSLGVLDIARTTGAIIVRGNHEQKLLDWHQNRERWIRGDDGALPPIGKMHRDLGRALRPIDWSLLTTSKIWVDLPDHQLRVIHAGVDPAVPFERQKPDTMLRIRTVIAPGRKRGEGHVLWGTRYTGPPHIVFGHNAAPGLQLHSWATGLDTGCVYGGRLTALVLAQGQKVPRSIAARRALLVSCPARRVWFLPAHRAERSA
ncbi:MAG: serine/threonine protein phosphatase [Labilithrix sp.]|nr:serine/threonine protein phosphatase [Labilithrix sp.]